MWHFANLFERYTASVASTFIRLAAIEAEANRRALADIRARQAKRDRLIVPERELYVPPRLVDAHEGEELTAEIASQNLVHVPEAGEVLEAIAERQGEAGDRPEEVEAATQQAPLPMGVRGEVVHRYVHLLKSAGRNGGEVIEKLRKDKKVRVAELQIIAAEVLGEGLTRRKKAEHLDALRRHVGNPGRQRWSAEAPTLPHPA